jgi:hypothetical protein
MILRDLMNHAYNLIRIHLALDSMAKLHPAFKGARYYRSILNDLMATI